jgi:hypothetical protein
MGSITNRDGPGCLPVVVRCSDEITDYDGCCSR